MAWNQSSLPVPEVPSEGIKTVDRRPEGRGQHGRQDMARDQQPKKVIENYATAAGVRRDDDRITILGIPFDQITPATQAALAGLVSEINYLRGLVRRYERATLKRAEGSDTAVLEAGAFLPALDGVLAKEPPAGEGWVTVMVHVATYEDIRRSSGVLAANATLADVASRMRDIEIPASGPVRFAVLGYAGGSNLAAAISLPQQDLDPSVVSMFVRDRLLATGYSVSGIDMSLALTVAAAPVGAGESGLLALARTDHLLLRQR